MELVRDTEAVIQYSLERYSRNVFVVGSSQGGIVAFYIAASQSRVRGVVCHNLADLSDPESVRLTRYPTLSRLLKPLLAISRIAPNVQIPISLYLDLKREETRLFGNAKNFVDQDPLALKSISLRAMASLANTPLPCPLEKVPTPVMILHGEKDSIFPRDYVEKIFERLPQPKMFHLVKDRPHLLLTDYVDEVIPPVEQWFREMLSRPSPKGC
jgi:pimeloyl-ACP methyl ester carboxylesterase